MQKRSLPHTESVFLNLPFERAYEPVLVGYVVGLITLGLAPRSVLELDEDGSGRMERLFRLMKQCDASIHDLSYQGEEFRYNMPFELGIAYTLTKYKRGHRLVICEPKKRDLLKTLTDLRSFDPKVHGMKGEKALSIIYDCFHSPSISDPSSLGVILYKNVMDNITKLRVGHDTLFNRRSFLILVHDVKSWAEIIS